MKNIIILLLITLSISNPYYKNDFIANNHKGFTGFSNNFKNNPNNNNDNNNNNNNIFVGGGNMVKIKRTETQEEPLLNVPRNTPRRPLIKMAVAPKEKEIQQVQEVTEQQLLDDTAKNEIVVPQKFNSRRYSPRPHKLHEPNRRPIINFDNEPFNPYGYKSNNKFLSPRKNNFVPNFPKINFDNDELAPEEVEKKVAPITDELKYFANSPEHEIPPYEFDRFYQILNGYPDLEPIFEQLTKLERVHLNQINEIFINDAIDKINDRKDEIRDDIKERNEENQETNEKIIEAVVKELKKLVDDEVVKKKDVLDHFENIIKTLNNDILKYLSLGYERINNVNGDFVPLSIIEETINDLNSKIKK